MTDQTDAIPDPAERARRNAALLTDGTETGWWDEHGRPAPWPEDINDYQPTQNEPHQPSPGEPLF